MELLSALVTPLHTKGSHINAACSWSFTAPWPAGPLTRRVLRTSPNPSCQYGREGMSHQPRGTLLSDAQNRGSRPLHVSVYSPQSPKRYSAHMCACTHKCACVCTHSHAHILPLCEPVSCTRSHTIERTRKGAGFCLTAALEAWGSPWIPCTLDSLLLFLHLLALLPSMVPPPSAHLSSERPSGPGRTPLHWKGLGEE